MTTAAGWAGRLLADWPDCGAAGVDVGDDAGDDDGDEVVDWAESGAMALTGRTDGPPIVPPGTAATAARGAELAFRSLTDVSSVPHGWHRMLGERAALSRRRRAAPWSVGGSCRAVATADGWVAVNLARPDDVTSVAALVEVETEPSDPTAAWRALDRWFAATPTMVVVNRAALLGLPVGAIPPAPAMPSVARPVIQRLDIASGSPAVPGDRPLVVDLSALWAGPLCAHLLAAAGARVVKLETAGRLDGARNAAGGFYALLNSGHDSVVVDLTEPKDRLLLARLCDRADIVITSCRPRAWRSLGIDPYDVCRRSPTTWVAITGYGLDQGDRVGFGDDVAMAAGLVAREGETGRPLPCGDALADPLTGMHAAVAALAAFRSGGSRVLDVSMYAVTAATLTADAGGCVVWQAATAGWMVETGRGLCRVEPPVARAPSGVAASAGRDTKHWQES